MTTTDRPPRTTEPTTADERRWWRENFARPCTEAMRFLIRLLDDLAERDARIAELERRIETTRQGAAMGYDGGVNDTWTDLLLSRSPHHDDD